MLAKYSNNCGRKENIQQKIDVWARFLVIMACLLAILAWVEIIIGYHFKSIWSDLLVILGNIQEIISCCFLSKLKAFTVKSPINLAKYGGNYFWRFAGKYTR